jgi:hypothetical protein
MTIRVLKKRNFHTIHHTLHPSGKYVILAIEPRFRVYDIREF